MDLLGVDDGKAYIAFGGGCQGCGMVLTQAQVRDRVVEAYVQRGIAPERVFLQSFNRSDVEYWIRHFPAFAPQVVYLDGGDALACSAHETTSEAGTCSLERQMAALRARGLRILAPALWLLVTSSNATSVGDGSKYSPSPYARAAHAGSGAARRRVRATSEAFSRLREHGHGRSWVPDAYDAHDGIPVDAPLSGGSGKRGGSRKRGASAPQHRRASDAGRTARAGEPLRVVPPPGSFALGSARSVLDAQGQPLEPITPTNPWYHPGIGLDTPRARTTPVMLCVRVHQEAHKQMGKSLT